MSYNSVNKTPRLIQFLVTNSRCTYKHFCQVIAPKIQLVNLFLLLTLGGGVWIANEVIALQVAQAETAQINITVERQGYEDYKTLLRRAEAAAREAVQQRFEQDSQITDVAITVLAENQGAIAPVFSVQVSRNQWQNPSEKQRWVTYYPSAEILLGFRDVAVTANRMKPGSVIPGMGNFRRSR